MNRVGVIILAAGAGKRFGEPKVLAKFKGEAFLARVLELLKEGGLVAIPRIIVLDPSSPVHDEVLRKFSDESFDVEINHFVDNPDAATGMLSSIRAGLSALEAIDPPFTHAALLPVDHPGIAPATIRALLAQVAATPTAIVVPSFENRRGHPGIFPRDLFPALHAAPDDEGARVVLRDHAARIVHVMVDDPATLHDIDTPQDLP